jgi:heme-degrading monooxygenase HmoA
MYVRVTAIRTDPSRVDSGIAYFEDEAVPGMRSARGYAGAGLLVDRETGAGAGITYWETLADMNAAEQMGQQARRRSSESTGAEVIDVDRFELILLNRASDPAAPSFSRIEQLYGDPQRLDEGIAFVREKVLPNLSKQKGYQSLLLGANRMTGRVVMTSSWRTAEDRAASEAAVVDQRATAARILQAKQVDVTLLEVAFIEIKQPTRAS